MAASKRPERVGELIRAELSAMILSDLHDPAIGFVTITNVAMSADLRTARVYFSCLGGTEEFEKVREGFDRAAGYLRREIGRRCRLRYAPELHFFPDRSAETGARIEQILRENRPAGDDAAAPRDDEETR
ncbi:MAG TPA: 30S ribosome-binding factor RbfA [Thermoanaerobaculia bacterium]|nr:30S ribosome-binding factor RbfA [Thermoanaerobaculia bacterium]